jgi:biotin operon repressor
MNPTAGSILALLKRSSAHLSGEAIGAELRISRSAVAKQISALRRAGYGIESVPNRGHRLLATADTPLPEEVVPFLRTRSIGRVIRFLDTADSTNAVAAREAAAGATEGTVVVADAQTAGRGRQQRAWNSPAGCNLYFSIVLRPTVPLNRFEEEYTEWQAARDLTPLLPYLERHSSLANRTIEVRGTRDRAEGRVAGLTPEGELILRTGRSKSTTVACGDVHVIGGRRGATKTPTGDR